MAQNDQPIDQTIEIVMQDGQSINQTTIAQNGQSTTQSINPHTMIDESGHPIDLNLIAAKLDLADLKDDPVLPTNQSTNPSVNQSTTQPTSQSTTQPTTQPVNQPANQFIKQSANRPKHPVETCNWLSYLTWWHVSKIFRVGKTKLIEIDDLPDIPLIDQSDWLTDQWERHWQDQIDEQKAALAKQQSINPSLANQSIKCPSVWINIYRMFCWKLVWRGSPLAIVTVAKIAQPLLVREMVYFLTDNDNQSVDQSEVDKAYGYAFLLPLACLVASIVQHQYFFNVYRTGAQMRTTLSAAIYRHALKVRTYQSIDQSNDKMNSQSTGNLTNLIAVDCTKFEEFCIYFNYFWNVLLEAAVAIGLLVDSMGVSTLVGIAVLFAIIPVQSLFSHLFAKLRRTAIVHTDARVRAVNEVLSASEVIKLYVFEPSLSESISQSRAEEFKDIKRAARLKALNQAIFFFIAPVISFLTFITYQQTGGVLRPADIFFVVAMFSVIRLPIALFLSYAVQATSEARVAVQRMQAFFEVGFHATNSLSINEQNVQARISPENAPGTVKMSHASFTWEGSSVTQSTNQSGSLSGLVDLSFVAPPGQLTAIIGSIGSGKSSLLCALLGEMRAIDTQTVNPSLSPDEVINKSVLAGRVAYAPQNAWIFTGTIRDNILLGRPMNRVRYLHTLWACCLIDDLLIFDTHDQTIIGERGVNLSGGQRARVALARAVYSDVDVYLLDDALAALDPIVARRVFYRCFGSSTEIASSPCLLAGRTRLLITHQTQFLSQAAHLMVLDRGRIIAQGDWQHLMDQPEIKSTLVVHGAQKQEDQAKTSVEHPGTVTVVPAVAGDIPIAAVEMETETTSDPVVIVETPVDPVTSDTTAEVKAPKKSNQSIVADEVSLVGRVGLSVYLSLVAGKPRQRMYVAKPAKQSVVTDVENPAVVEKPVMKTTYSWAGILYAFFVTCVLMVVGQGASIASDRWLASWANQSSDDQSDLLNVYVYLALVIFTIIVSVVRADLFFQLILDGSSRLHDAMVRGVLFASMRWLESQPHGRTLNRFAKDQSIVDDMLPLTSFDAMQNLIMTLGALAAIASVAPYILAIIAPLIPIFIWFRSYYLHTSRQIKRLDATTRSPVYAFFSSTLNGLIPIRAFGVTEEFTRTFLDRLDVNTKPVFSFFTSVRWFGVRLDALCVLLVFATSFLMIGLRDVINPAEAGFALSYSLMLTSLFQWAIRQSAEVVNQMTAVERIKEYGDLPPEGAFTIEDDPSLTNPPPEWPTAGAVTFDNYSMRYRPGLPLVHRNLSINIRAGEKVAIVGKTGAGKSSVFQALFRLVDRSSGRILVDGVDIFTLPLHRLRQSLSVIPQVPVIFSNTLRFNLDPFNEHTDEAIWSALRSVQLEPMIRSLPNLLSTMMSEGGSNFSVGETQLICVARAILKPSRILCIDEATSNVDNVTDQKIQQIIRTQFESRTVITIAHRLKTILHCDRIAVLDKGQCVEFGSVDELSRIPNGIFASMLEASKQGKEDH